jgi:hypothetical protein
MLRRFHRPDKLGKYDGLLTYAYVKWRSLMERSWGASFDFASLRSG